MSTSPFTVNNAGQVKVAGQIVATVELYRHENDYAWRYRLAGADEPQGEFRTKTTAARAAVDAQQH